MNYRHLISYSLSLFDSKAWNTSYNVEMHRARANSTILHLSSMNRQLYECVYENKIPLSIAYDKNAQMKRAEQNG